MLRNTVFKGMDTFLVIWAGQLVSLLGTAMTRFALLVWAYQQTGQATTLALLGFFSTMSGVVASPLAGVVIDRFNRRTVMIIADAASGLMTLGMLILYATGNLQVWHLFVAETLTGIFESFQIPAYIAATTLIVPKDQYARAAGMRGMARSVGRVIAPFAAGVLLPLIHIDGIMTIDVISLFAALGTLLIVRIPMTPQTDSGRAASGSFLQEARVGFRFIFERRGLVGLLLFFALAEFFSGITYFSVLPAMVLSRQGGGEFALASVQSALGAGALIGALLVSAFGVPKRKIYAVLVGAALSFMFGDLGFAFGQAAIVWVVAGFFGEFTIPAIISADQAIWQAKVPVDVQGRVFAAQNIFKGAASACGFLAAGPIADLITEPGMMPGGVFAPVFGPLVGVGPGTGIAMTFIFTGVIGITVSLGSLLMKSVRDIETELPDAPVPEVDAAAIEPQPA